MGVGVKHLDRLFNLSVADVKATVMRTVFRSKGEAAPTLVAATAMMLLLLCERHKIKVTEVLTAANNMLRVAQDKMPVEIRALRRYVREELPDV